VPITGIRAARRVIPPEAGHALEILGHAIEYLTDEFVHRGETIQAGNPDMEAVQMLMALNRQIYFACPEVPSFSQRFRGWFRGSASLKSN
jgi:hypothetical protein